MHYMRWGEDLRVDWSAVVSWASWRRSSRTVQALLGQSGVGRVQTLLWNWMPLV